MRKNRKVMCATSMKDKFDEKSAYCRSLGHHVPFHYCRTVNNSIPCRKIRDCWFEQIDIDHYLAEQYTESERELIFAPPPHKLTSLMDIIKKAQEKSWTFNGEPERAQYSQSNNSRPDQVTPVTIAIPEYFYLKWGRGRSLHCLVKPRPKLTFSPIRRHLLIFIVKQILFFG